MQLTDTILILISAAGLILLLFGLFFSIYPKRGMFLYLPNSMNLEAIAAFKPFKKFLSLVTPPQNSRLYKLSHKIIRDSESEIKIETLFLLKVLCILLTAATVIAVRQTNMDVMKISVISRPAQSFALFVDRNSEAYSYNFTLYTAVLKRIGKDKLKKLDNNEKLEEVKKALPDFLHTNSKELIEARAASIVSTFNAVESIRLINVPSVLIITLSFWFPELFLVFRQVLRSSSYKKEVIKLENIFELMGSINGFRTIDIITEMEKSSASYRKHLKAFKDLFKRDRELALKNLKLAVKNKRFSRLVDVFRIYSLIDKEVAVDILERNRLEKEEQIFMTAEEDIDMVDIIAFISIVPILWELANLMMKPMLDMIFDAFKFV